MHRPIIYLDFFVNDSTASKLCHLEAQDYCFTAILHGYCQLTRGDSEERNTAVLELSAVANNSQGTLL